MFAIYKRELKSYFHTIIGWLFIAIMLFFINLFTTIYNLQQGSPYISYALQSAMLIFIIAIPILTMRSLAEERKNKTDQLILTAPVSVNQIVWGKYLSMETILAIPSLVACLFPLIMSRYGTVPFAESYIAILGFFLFGSTTIAIGLFISSLTENQMIAAVVSVAIIFVGYVMSGLCSVISTSGNLLTKILGCYDLTTPFTNLSSGNFNIASIVYYVSIILLLLFLTVQTIQKRRYSVSSQTFSMGAYNSTLVVIAIAVTIFANLLVNQIPSKYTKFDMTTEKLYSLTSSTDKVLDGLKDDITINVLAKESSMDTTVKETLKRYEDYSKHIKVNYVDPTTNPNFYQQYTDSTLASGSLIVVSNKRNKVIAYSSLYETSYDYNNQTSNTTGYDGEGQLTSAISYVTSNSMPVIDLVTGHGEADFDTNFTGAITKLNIDYDKLTLLTAKSIPTKVQCIVINGPTSDFSADDVKKVQDYINNGGNVVFIYGYTTKDLTNYKKLISDNGVNIEKGMVVEGDSTHYYQYPNYLLPTVKADDITSKIPSNGYVFMPNASGITIDQKAADAGTVTYLLETSKKAFSRIDVQNNSSVTKADGDVDGPFALGAKVTKKLAKGESNIVVYTSTSMFTNDADQSVAGNNQLLFTGTLSQVVSVQNSVNIPVKEYKMTSITVSSANIILISLLITVLLPIALIVAGLVIWLERRKK